MASGRAKDDESETWPWTKDDESETWSRSLRRRLAKDDGSETWSRMSWSLRRCILETPSVWKGCVKYTKSISGLQWFNLMQRWWIPYLSWSFYHWCFPINITRIYTDDRAVWRELRNWILVGVVHEAKFGRCICELSKSRRVASWRLSAQWVCWGSLRKRL